MFGRLHARPETAWTDPEHWRLLRLDAARTAAWTAQAAVAVVLAATA